MSDREFCDKLEYKISEILAHAADEKIKRCWCDCVLMTESDNYYSQKFINDNRFTKLRAYVGEGGESTYDSLLEIWTQGFE